MKKNRLLVVGSTGFIGTNVVRKFTEFGYEIISFSRSGSVIPSGVYHVQGDLQNPRTVRKLLQLKPDLILLSAGISGQAELEKVVDRSFDVNVTSQLFFLDQAVRLTPGSKIIFISSRLEYGKPQYLPIDETHPVAPLSFYGLHKSQVSGYIEFLYRKFGLDATVLRVSNLYGPHKPVSHPAYNIINYYIDLALQGKTLKIYGSGNQARDYLFIDDFTELLQTVFHSVKTAGEIYNIGSGQGLSLKEAVKTIIKISGKGKWRSVSWPKTEKNLETGSSVMNITKIINHTGWRPRTDFSTGVEKTVQNLKSV